MSYYHFIMRTASCQIAEHNFMAWWLLCFAENARDTLDVMIPIQITAVLIYTQKGVNLWIELFFL